MGSRFLLDGETNGVCSQRFTVSKALLGGFYVVGEGAHVGDVSRCCLAVLTTVAPQHTTVLAAAPYPGNNPAPQKRRSGVRVNWAFTERIFTTSRVCSKTAQTAANFFD